MKDKEGRLWPQFLRSVGRMPLDDCYPGEERVPPAKAEKLGPVSVCSKNHNLRSSMWWEYQVMVWCIVMEKPDKASGW